jgi:hypothetical protein
LKFRKAPRAPRLPTYVPYPSNRRYYRLKFYDPAKRRVFYFMEPMMASPKPEQLTWVAPGMSRAKS